MSLSFMESEAANQVSRSLNSLAALVAHLPDRASCLRGAVVDGLDNGGRELLCEVAGAVHADRYAEAPGVPR